MKEREETFTELMQRALIFPQVYRGVIVTRLVGAYECLGVKCKNQQEVDNVINKSLKNLAETIIK